MTGGGAVEHAQALDLEGVAHDGGEAVQREREGEPPAEAPEAEARRASARARAPRRSPSRHAVALPEQRAPSKPAQPSSSIVRWRKA